MSKLKVTMITKIHDWEIEEIKICDEVWRDGDYLQLRWYDEKQTETIFVTPTRTITFRIPETASSMYVKSSNFSLP